MNYELRQYDSVLLTFHIERSAIGEISYFIDWIDEQHKHLLPIGMEATGEGLGRWLSSRVIPKNREFVDQILSRSGLSHNDTMGIINLCKGLSLNDSYWVVEQGFEGKFENYNLYQNSFARALALIAYTGYGSATKRGFSSSPEYTTNGMLRKCWRRINRKIYLYKGGTTGAANTGNEPYSEYYSAQIADRMGLYHVSYGLAKWKGMVCSTCELFTDMDTSYVPIYKFLGQCTLTKVAVFLRNLGESFYNCFVDMLIFDSLIYNTDRHFGNFGLLVDNKTNLPIAFAPIFDNGLSLFNYAMDDDLRDLGNYAKTRRPAFEGVTYEAIVNEFVTDRQRAQLRKMINFNFKKHPKYNLPANRLKRIEEHLQKRMLGYHESQSESSLWTRCPVKDLYVEPLDLASSLAANDKFAPGISKDAVYDTMANLGLAIRVNGEYYPVRETAYRSLLGRAKISGTALPKLKKQELADVLNTCLQLFKRDALVLVRDEKVSAVHSGDDSDYSILPIDELIKTLQAKLDLRFPGNVFKEGYSDHSVTSGIWEFPKQKESLLGAYKKMLSHTGKPHIADKLIPGIRFTTSDTGVASAKVSALLLGGEMPIHIGSCISVDHRNHNKIENFERALDQLFAQFGDSIGKLQDLAQVWLSYPVNAMTRICKKLCLPKKAALEAVRMFEASNGGGPATAHDVFMALQEILFNLKAEKTPQSKILLVEESIARTLSMDWEEYDLAKAVNY